MAHIDFKEALGWGADQMQDLRSVGYDYLRQGHYETAIIYFEALTALDSSGLFDAMTLGALYLQTRQYRLALPMLDHALALDPTNRSIQLNRAKTLLGMGQVDEGLAIAQVLTSSKEAKIRDLAEALVMAYS